MTSRPLRIGAMLDSTTVPAWVAHQLAEVDRLECAELVSFLVNGEREPETPRRSFVERALRPHPNWLFYKYQELDRRQKRAKQPAVPDAFEEVDLAARFPAVDTRTVVPLSPKPWEHRFDDDTVAEIRALDLDVLVRYGFKIIRGEILDCARYGVWSHHHGDNRFYRGGPALFWEMYERNPVSGTVLQVLTEELDAGGVIYRSQSPTDFTSLHLNRNATYWKTAHFLPRRLRDLHRHGFERLEALPTYRERVDATRPIYKPPKNAVMVRFLARLGLERLRARMRDRAAREQWWIATRARDREYELVEPPAGRFYADPFVLDGGERSWILFEDFDFESGRGIVSYVPADEPGAAPEPALERPHHLAYPFVMRHEGNAYLVPDTSTERTVELWRADRVPDRWTLDRTLMRDIEAVDVTLHRHEGRWWLFAAVPPYGGTPHDELCLFFADSLEGEWTPHPGNPVVSDVRCARPAGALFRENGSLIRPAQDCSARYGYAVDFREVVRLTPDEYEERPAGRRIDPRWRRGNLGSHTYNSAGGYEVVDGRFLVTRGYRRLPGLGRLLSGPRPQALEEPPA